MGMQRNQRAELQRTRRWSLLMGVAASISSLMVGLFFQTVFYEIAQNLPAVYRQDSHISLPLCNVFPDIYGCKPWVGALTGLEIWQISLQVGQISGLIFNLILVAVFSFVVTVRVRSDRMAPGVLIGMACLVSSLVLALTFNVPLNTHSP